jgi:hypothetical protein
MQLDLTALEHLADGFRRLIDPDCTPLMVHWEQVIDADNRKGVLQGLDKDGVPMAPVKYRPRPPGPRKPTKAQRGGQRANAKKGGFLGLGATAYGNLTSSEYRLLGGPPLAPRDQFSRVITNLKTGHGREGGNWYAMGYWDEVLDRKGHPFLHWHFHGASGGGKKRNVTLPKRDLRGVRPDGRAKALDALRNFARLLIRQTFG